MGFFDKIFKKGKKAEKEAAPAKKKAAPAAAPAAAPSAGGYVANSPIEGYVPGLGERSRSHSTGQQLAVDAMSRSSTVMRRSSTSVRWQT